MDKLCGSTIEAQIDATSFGGMEWAATTTDTPSNGTATGFAEECLFEFDLNLFCINK
jgi:hypothetical protein